ncbi:translation initiation factor eIF 4e-like domain-containing protein [Amylostereum chailletii]|nr:translation initiation factor eIF 4e-like domain-containing protein [Amylostereum chailletii]
MEQSRFVAASLRAIVPSSRSAPSQWIWVRGPQKPKLTETGDEAVSEAAEYLETVTENVEKIKNDPSIPVRSNKKTGAKSKKELREVEQTRATEKLREISLRTGYVSGKWLIFAPPEKVDAIWATVATSVASGPLASTSAYLAKVATFPRHETPNYQHVLCIYMPDVYDKAAVTEVLKVLLRDHGLTTLGVKSNLYTMIGLDSKHPSGIPSTVWKNTAVLPESEIKALKDAYFAELDQTKVLHSEKSEAGSADAKEEGDAPNVKAKPKGKAGPKLKKKAKNDDPFSSDDEGETGLPSHRKSKGKRTSESGEDEENGPRKKRTRAK